MSAKDYYKILGVSSRADDQAIKQAFRQLARRYHPDVNPRSKAKFQEINEAYQVLGDTTKRARYDRLLREMSQIVTAPPRNAQPSPPPTHSYPKHRDPRKTTATPIVSTHEKLTGITLVIFVLFCGVMAFSFYHLANFLSGDSSNVLNQPTLTRNDWLTQTAIRRASATAESIPTSTAAPDRRQLALTSNLSFEELIAQFREDAGVGCSINLSREAQTCHMIDWHGSPAQIIIRTGPRDGAVNLRLNLDPRNYFLTRVVFVITFSDDHAPSGLTVNISDSDDNDGYSRSRLNGDHNSQITISGTSMTIFSNTYAPRNLSELVSLSDFVAAGSTLVLEISDQRVRWWTADGGESLDSQYLFALGGQSETIRDLNYDIFAAFNGAVILGSTASGRGVEQIDIMLLPAN